MTNDEIKEAIECNNLKIKQLLEEDKFVLNKKINELVKQNNLLQEKCTHIFINGSCIYCFKEKENE